MNKKKVLHIENSTHLTGAFKALLGICEEIKQDYESIVALPQKSECNQLLAARDIAWKKLPFYELRKSLKALLLYLPKLMANTKRVVQYVKRNHIMIIHANDHFNLVAPLAKMLLKKKVKLVVHVRLLPSTYNHQLYSLFRHLNTRYADKLIAVSYAIHKAYRQPPHMLVVRDRIVLKEQRPSFVVRNDAPLKFVYISNYIQGKGQDLALNAFIKIAAEQQDCELHFYGGDMGLEKNKFFRERLEALAKGAGLYKRVFFHGFVADTESIYKAHDISLCFSESESFSLICIESQFYGIPVIAAASGGPQEIIEHEKNGILVANRNIDEMAAAMKHLLGNFALRKKLSNEGKLRAIEIMQATPSFQSVLDQL